MRAYKAVLPDERAEPHLRRIATLAVIVDAVRKQLDRSALSALTAKIEALLDASIEGVDITAPIWRETEPESIVDLSGIDFEKLAAVFTTS